VALIIWDKVLSEQLLKNIQRDINPRNSWVVWKRKRPLGLDYAAGLIELVNATVEGVTSIDLWPARHTSCFELRPGCKPVPPGDPDFYDNYTSVGNFPMVSETDDKQIYTRLFKAFGKVLTPIL